MSQVCKWCDSKIVEDAEGWASIILPTGKNYVCLSNQKYGNRHEPSPAVPEANNVFWVIERFEKGKSQGYWFGNSSREFSSEIDRAVQFRRKEDARRILLSWHWKDCEVTEHIYIAPAVPETVIPEDLQPYRVEVERNGCEGCGAGRMWDVVFTPEDCALGTTYGSKEEAEDMATELNDAFNKGLASATGKGL